MYSTILDAEGVSGRRGIYVDVSGTTTVVIEGLTVENGFAENAMGGGIYIADGTVVLRQLVVRNSRRSGDWGTNRAVGFTCSMEMLLSKAARLKAILQGQIPVEGAVCTSRTADCWSRTAFCGRT